LLEFAMDDRPSTLPFIRTAAPVSPSLTSTTPSRKEWVFPPAFRSIDLMAILRLKRPSADWEGWFDAVRAWMPPGHTVLRDEKGTPMAIRISCGNNAPFLFCSHLDTVHDTRGHQAVTIHEGWASTPEGECLGADDGAGVWLMLEMLAAGVQGDYLFHFGEERCCEGANWMCDHHSEWLSRHAMAIEFDRPGVSDITTHFMGFDAFPLKEAQALADALHPFLGEDYALAPTPNGRSTDVTFYVDLIPRCTNISVGYFQKHGPHETLDLVYLDRLREGVIALFS
jgi:hypothetical protein